MNFIAAFVAIFLLLWIVFYGIGPALERLLRRGAHFTSSFRYRDYLPVFVLLGAGIAATAFAGHAFLDLAEGLQAESPRLTRVDAEIHEWARTTRSSGSTTFFTTLTIIGTPLGLSILLFLVSIYLAFQNRWRWIAYLVITCGVGGLLNLQLKGYFARARPELAEALRDAHGYSFPSGHAMGSTIVFGALAYLAFRILNGWKQRAAALAAAVTMFVAISMSRIYLGVHWISDVGAGIAAGMLWVVVATLAYETFRRIRLVRSLRAKRAAESGTT